MTSFSYQQLVHDTATALGAAPDAALATFRVESRQESGLRSRVATRSFEVHVDAHCPVLDLLSNATPVVLELSARPADEAAA